MHACVQAQRDSLWWIPLTLLGEHPGANSPVPAAVTGALNSGGFTSKVWATIGSAEQVCPQPSSPSWRCCRCS